MNANINKKEMKLIELIELMQLNISSSLKKIISLIKSNIHPQTSITQSFWMTNWVNDIKLTIYKDQWKMKINSWIIWLLNWINEINLKIKVIE